MAKTPAEKWKEQIQNYKKNCQKIMKTSKSLRYVGVINEYGRTLTGIIQPGLKPLLNSEQAKNEFFIVSTLTTLRKEPSKALGDLDYVILKHKKATIIAFQKTSVTYYLSFSDKLPNIEKIITKVKKVI